MTSRKKKQPAMHGRKKRPALDPAPTLAFGEPTAPEAGIAPDATAATAASTAAPVDEPSAAPTEPGAADAPSPAPAPPSVDAPDESAGPVEQAPDQEQDQDQDQDQEQQEAPTLAPTAGPDDDEWAEPPDSVPPPAASGSKAEDGPEEIISSIGSFRWPDDIDVTVNLTGGLPSLRERDDLADPTRSGLSDDVVIVDRETLGPLGPPNEDVTERHLRGLLEALVFASDAPVRPAELARRAETTTKEVRRVLAGLRTFYLGRGIQLDEVGGAWVFRTNPVYAPFVRELTGQKPVKLTRAQIETLSILAYRQPITRPEIDDIRGVDSGPVLKLLLERDLIKILGKKDEPGRPILYGTTPQFLEFFGIHSLKDLPTLREFTELNDDSKRVVERELGESYDEVSSQLAEERAVAAEALGAPGETEELGAFEEGTGAESEAPAEIGDTRVDEALAAIERASAAPDAIDAGEIEEPGELLEALDLSTDDDDERDADPGEDALADDGFALDDDSDESASDDDSEGDGDDDERADD